MNLSDLLSNGGRIHISGHGALADVEFTSTFLARRMLEFDWLSVKTETTLGFLSHHGALQHLLNVAIADHSAGKCTTDP